ncbi:unnamed protein product [Vitrella brassicaformis CCMP3155]|uniref:Uncharacterized protein n=1 Tax=Vitrella brassicaformis (strain CCMP3155) TaxID=1169540 RepID=A0A0G4EYI5_VITBC|nr:unnamed protein product [Vitrella brassicaformis CCMP3155]|eukprot:CEM03515.1 unnamed protein product [Vitrella brassicaformis CCMP3155]
MVKASSKSTTASKGKTGKGKTGKGKTGKGKTGKGSTKKAGPTKNADVFSSTTVRKTRLISDDHDFASASDHFETAKLPEFQWHDYAKVLHMVPTPIPPPRTDEGNKTLAVIKPRL